ncbi:MAG: hypothetical protein ACOYVK_02165 [Bacillota bacterium]
MQEFFKVDYIERFIGYADAVHMSDNLEKIKFSSDFELELCFKEGNEDDSFIIIGVFNDKEILYKEQYKNEKGGYLLGFREGMTTLMIINENETQIIEEEDIYEKKLEKRIQGLLRK